jgi:monolysocardiolipin acyltransferase
MLLSAMLPWSFFLTDHLHGRVRWSLCARELCYRNPALAAFFKSGKTLPIERGAGTGQPVMRVAAGAVARGGWVHLFPEGRVIFTGSLGPLRWGVGKVFCDAVGASGRTPTVLPFYHSGMGRVMPRRGRIPRAGHDIHVAVGEPVYLEDLAARCGKEGEDQRCVWGEVAGRIAVALRELEARVPPNWDQVPGREAEEMARRSEGAMPNGSGSGDGGAVAA